MSDIHPGVMIQRACDYCVMSLLEREAIDAAGLIAEIGTVAKAVLAAGYESNLRVAERAVAAELLVRIGLRLGGRQDDFDDRLRKFWRGLEEAFPPIS
jgi:hypothetical protein